MVGGMTVAKRMVQLVLLYLLYHLLFGTALTLAYALGAAENGIRAVAVLQVPSNDSGLLICSILTRMNQ